MLKLKEHFRFWKFQSKEKMANLLKTIIENDRGEIKRLEKWLTRSFSYEEQMAAFDR